jgi:hypothetical protein
MYTPEKRFNMCLESKEVAEQVIASFDNYIKCRIGNNLAPNSENNTSLMQVLKDSCLGLDIKADPKKFQDPNEANAYYQSALHEAFRNIARQIKEKLKDKPKDKPKKK